MPPVRVGSSIADLSAALFGVIGILAALLQRAPLKLREAGMIASVYILAVLIPALSNTVFVELRDVGYPGSTYSLECADAGDRLEGNYFQAAQGADFPVEFVREE